MSDSVRPHRQQPTRLPRPWDSPGKNTGVGCHFFLQYMKVKSESESEVVYDSQRPHETTAYQAPPSMGFSRQEHWSGVPLPSPVTSTSNSQLSWDVVSWCLNTARLQMALLCILKLLCFSSYHNVSDFAIRQMVETLFILSVCVTASLLIGYRYVLSCTVSPNHLKFFLIIGCRNFQFLWNKNSSEALVKLVSTFQ